MLVDCFRWCDVGNGGVRHAEHIAGAGAELRGSGLVLCQGQDAAVIAQGASITDDIEAVGAWCLSCGADKHAAGAIGVFQPGSGFIFHLDVVVFAETAKALQASRHSAKPLQDIQVVDALVEQQAAPFTHPGGAPVTEAFATEIGADGYAFAASGAVELVNTLLQ